MDISPHFSAGMKHIPLALSLSVGGIVLGNMSGGNVLHPSEQWTSLRGQRYF